MRLAVMASVVVVLGAGWVAVRHASRPPSPSGSAVALSADPPEVAFGEVPQGEVVSRTVRVANRLPSDIRITGVIPSCGCSTVAPADAAVPAGGETTITVTFRSGVRIGEQRHFVKVVGRAADGESVECVIPVTALVRAFVRLDPAEVVFPAVGLGETQSAEVAVRYDPACPPHRLPVPIAQSGELAVNRIPAAGDDPADRFRVDFRPTRTAGQRTLSVHFDPGIVGHPPVRLGLSATVLSSFVVSPPSLLLGLIPPSGVMHRRIHISGGSMAPTVRSVPDFAAVRPVGAEAGGWAFAFDLRPERLAPRQVVRGAVVFDTGSPVEPEVTVPVLGVIGDLTAADDEGKP